MAGPLWDHRPILGILCLTRWLHNLWRWVFCKGTNRQTNGHERPGPEGWVSKNEKRKKLNYEKMKTFVFSKLSLKNPTYRRHQSVTNTFFWPNTINEYYSTFRNHRVPNIKYWYWQNPNTEYQILFGIEKILIRNMNSTIRLTIWTLNT